MSAHVVFYTDGLDNPASRFRAEQFFEPLRHRGFRCSLRYAYGRRYNEWFHSPLSAPYKLACRMKRALAQSVRFDADVTFLQRTAIPHTALPELVLVAAGRRFVFDFDDALHLGPGGAQSTARTGAARAAISLATRVIAGNAHLADWAGEPAKTTVIPTVVDTGIYTPSPFSTRAELVIGWMGTASNFPSLELAVAGIRDILREYPHVRMRIVSNAAFKPFSGHPQVEQVRWSRQDELALLRSFDVGLMPLQNNPSSRGKCAFKMIQYMSVGRPTVASAVGANRDVLTEQTGTLVEPGGDWGVAIRDYIESPASRRAAGEAARERAVSQYSIDAVLDDLQRVLEEAMER